MVYQNEKILSETATIKSGFPSDVLSFSEAALYVCEGIEYGYNKLFESIGIHELAVYESTGNMISYMEEESTALSVVKNDNGGGESENKKFLDKVVEWFKNIWGRIKGFFEMVLKKFNDFTAANRAKNRSKLTSADVSKLSDDKKFGKVSDYSNFSNNFGPNKDNFGNVSALQNEISNKFTKATTVEDAKNVFDDYSSTLAGKLIGVDNIEGANGLKSYIKGLVKDKAFEVTKSFLSSNLNDMVDYVFDGKNDIASIKGMYKNSRKVIDDAISTAKKHASEAKKDDSVISYAQYEYRVLKDLTQLMLTENSAILDVMKKRMSEYKMVLFRFGMAVGKIANGEAKEAKKNGKDNQGAETKATGESATNDLFASQVAMVEGAFSWI